MVFMSMEWIEKYIRKEEELIPEIVAQGYTYKGVIIENAGMPTVYANVDVMFMHVQAYEIDEWKKYWNPKLRTVELRVKLKEKEAVGVSRHMKNRFRHF